MVGIICEKGNFRSVNQDYVGFFEDEQVGIYVIADGMGGYNGGEIASRIAVTTTVQYIKDNILSDDLPKTLKDAILMANERVIEKSEKREELKEMGSTITACYIKGGIAVVANVGDSGCYVKKHNEVIKITKDHSLVQELLDSGDISLEEAKNHPNKNIITRALGTKKDVEIDIFSIDLQGVEKVILCTDGLSNFVTYEDIIYVLNEFDNKRACEELVELSKKNGSRDNISIILFEGESQNDR